MGEEYEKPEVKYRYSLTRITTPEQRKLAQQFVNSKHSYIDWAPRPSRLLYWLLHEEGGKYPWGQIVGVFGLGTMFNAPKTVADYMKTHDIGFNQVGNNIVYCLHGHQGKTAASQCLKLIRDDSVKWWHERYGDVLKAFQTFILPLEDGYRAGTLYKADNWDMVGMTSGSSFKTEQLKKKHEGATLDWLPQEEEQVLGWASETIVSDGKGGQSVLRINRTITEVPKKMIYMRLISPKEHRRALNIRSNRELRDLLETQNESTGDLWRAENAPESIDDNIPEEDATIEPPTQAVNNEGEWDEWPTYDFS